MDASADRRSATGLVKVTMIGCATPTVWPLMGRTEATVAADTDGAMAARLVGADAVIATRAIPAAAIMRRNTLAIAPCPGSIRPRRVIDPLTVNYSKP